MIYEVAEQDHAKTKASDPRRGHPLCLIFLSHSGNCSGGPALEHMLDCELHQ